MDFLMGRPRAYWIRLERSVFVKAKTYTASAKLDICRHQLVGHLADLWTWSMEETDDGTLPGDTPPEVIAGAAGWPGDPAAFFAALTEGSDPWIVRQPGGRLYLRGWKSANEQAIKKLSHSAAYYRSQQTKPGSNGGVNSPQRGSKGGEPTGSKQSTYASSVTESTQNRGEFCQNSVANITEQDRTERKKTDRPRARRTRNDTEIARDLVTDYENATGKPAPDRTIPMLAKQLAADPNLADDMRRALINYRLELEERPRDPQYIVAPHNWFGRAQRWQEHRTLKRPQPEAEPDTPTEHEIIFEHLWETLRDELKAAGWDRRKLSKWTSDFRQSNGHKASKELASRELQSSLNK